jgi:hypothetical protein
MTRKDFKIIAKAIANLDLPSSKRRYVAEEIADAIREEQQNFDFDKFIAACETPESEE